jgi:hypothetical protein
MTLADGTFVTPVDIVAPATDTYFSTNVTDSNITITMEKIVVNTIEVRETLIGDVNTDWLIDLFNVLFLPQNLILGMLN